MEGAGWTERRWSEAFLARGEDRVRFLNGYLTCEVAAENGSFGFFTHAKGGILADAVVQAREGEHRIVVPDGRGEALLEHLRRYVIADRVEFELEEGVAEWILAGEGAAGMLSALGVDVPRVEAREEWTTVTGKLGGAAVHVTLERDLGAPVFSIAAAIEDAAGVAGALESSGAETVDGAAFEAARIAAGVPRYGVDYDERHFPQETGLEDGISYTKGCYLGQEVVARIHYRGHVNHSLRALDFELTDSLTLPEPGTPVTFEGDEVGRVGSSARFEPDGVARALAVLHRKAAEPGTTVRVAGGLAAVVVVARSPHGSVI